MNVFDVIIIGFGKGGKTLAAEFAKRGQKVAIIERSEKMYGGTCINIGCIPTKTLVHQAKIAWGRKETAFEEKSDFYRQAIAVKETVTGALRNKNYLFIQVQARLFLPIRSQSARLRKKSC